MTNEETKKAIEVMQAWVNGELIEARVRGSGKWILVGCDPDWRWDIQDYRIKPEPMEIDVYFTPEGRPLVEGVVSREARRTWTKKKFREVIE